MKKIRISQISYLNTLPFASALSNSEYFKETSIITTDFPSECARKLANKEADIGLIPLAALGSLPEYNIITDFCIACDGEVSTVMLFSDVPLEQTEKIILDYQSKTSVMLTRLLAANYWEINPQWINGYKGYENDIREKTAGLIIGDRCFEKKGKYKYSYDLGKAWKEFSGKPFVFAVWVSTLPLKSDFINELNIAFEYGLQSIPYLSESFEKHNLTKFEIINYLTNNIQYRLDERKKLAAIEFCRLSGIQHKPVF